MYMKVDDRINQNYQEDSRSLLIEKDSRYFRRNDKDIMLKDTHVNYAQQDVAFFAEL